MEESQEQGRADAAANAAHHTAPGRAPLASDRGTAREPQGERCRRRAVSRNAEHAGRSALDDGAGDYGEQLPPPPKKARRYDYGRPADPYRPPS